MGCGSSSVAPDKYEQRVADERLDLGKERRRRSDEVDDGRSRHDSKHSRRHSSVSERDDRERKPSR